LAVTDRAGWFLMAGVFVGLGIGGTHTTLLSAVVDRAVTKRRASSVAAFAACWELGVGGGAIFVGRLADSVGFEAVFLAVAALPLVGLAFLHSLGNRKTTAPTMSTA
jgi:predicted MFS family arabinose efflux permease